MLIENQMIDIYWCPANKEHFINKGYVFTKWRDLFQVKAEDLQKTSTKKVKVKCDYCGKIYETTYKLYFAGIQENNKSACKKCAKLKREELFEEKHGVKNPFQLKETQEKIKQTNLEKYGVENPGQNEEIKERIKQTNLERYGVETLLKNDNFRKEIEKIMIERYGVSNPFMSKEFQDKAKQTNLEKYGVENISLLPEIVEKRKQTSLEKRGVECPFQDPLVIEKIRKSLSQNNSTPKSKSEIEMCNNLKEIFGEDKIFPEYPFEKITMDCLLVINDIKIDVEYDGWYWHKDRQEEDKKRNYYLLKKNFRIIRFVCKNKNPSKQQLKEAVDKIINEDKHLLIIKIDV